MHPYLENYAEPEAMGALAAIPSRTRYDSAVILPACGEAEFLSDSLDHLGLAASSAGIRALAIVVVNARDEHSESLHENNRRTLSALVPRPGLEIHVVDRASPGRRLPLKQGVGLARKIGGDVAVALYENGIVGSPIIHTTDADARVGSDYFSMDDEDGSAFLHPFVHDLDGDDDPLGLYEISLRYYVLGLRYAGSPYAFHTIGSTIAFHAKSYLAVRGFPKREAAEDFYFLSKCAKVGPVKDAPGGIRLLSRDSGRVPFGTGAGTRKIRLQLGRGEAFTLYHPAVFEELKAYLRALDRFPWEGWHPLLESERDEIEKLARNHPDPENLRRSLHSWFDAFRTLKRVHCLRDIRYPNLGYREALAGAPFTPGCDLKSPREIVRRVQELDSPRFAKG